VDSGIDGKLAAPVIPWHGYETFMHFFAIAPAAFSTMFGLTISPWISLIGAISTIFQRRFHHG
jgi:hypothetical protein